MVEPHQWLLARADEYGFKPENVGPASVDLELAGSIKEYKWIWYSGLPELIMLDVDMEFGKPVEFVPRSFYLCSTVEYIKVPTTHAALINMRSSLARKGLGHRYAGWIDPGFQGNVTLELETSVPVEVMVGERIVQIIYIRLTEETTKPYMGKYLGQRGPTEAYQ